MPTALLFQDKINSVIQTIKQAWGGRNTDAYFTTHQTLHQICNKLYKHDF